MENIIRFFIENRFKLSDYFKQIKVNREKTLIKFETKADNNISITFFIHGEPQKKELPFEDKINRIFRTKEDLSILDQLIAEINLPYYFTFSRFIKISKENEPTLHTFQITIIIEKK
jgi:hypothetical protein